MPAGQSRSEVILDNDRVHVERHVVEPGHWVSTSSDHRLLVFIKDGVVTSRSGRTSLWKAGRVWWQRAGDESGGGLERESSNSGVSAIDLVSVTLKPVETRDSKETGDPTYEYLNYPNIPGEDLLENDWVVVQRFVVAPGQWEGVHAHVPNMLYIHIKGGEWAARSATESEQRYPEPSPDGSVGWMPTIGIEEGHESGNVGKEPIDLIWVTLKR